MIKVVAATAAIASTALLSVSGADIVETLVGLDDYSTLVAAVTAGELVDALKGDGNLTVMAPTNAAFAQVGSPDDASSPLAHLLAPNEYNKELLQKVLTTHVIGARVASTDITFNQAVDTLNEDEQLLFLNDAGIQVTTVARTNDPANVIDPDIDASNGIIHGIDSVIAPQIELRTIAQLAESIDDLSSLVAALGKADLVTTFENVSATGNAWTVFAPTNAAFQATLTALNLTLDTVPVNVLTDILLAHVLDSACDSTCVTVQGDSIPTAGGETIMATQISLSDTFDQKALNGIVHIVDQVILPPSVTDPDADSTASPTPSPTVSFGVIDTSPIVAIAIAIAARIF